MNPLYARVLIAVLAIVQRILTSVFDLGHAEVGGAEVGALSTGLAGYLLGTALHRRPGDVPARKAMPSIPTFCISVFSLFAIPLIVILGSSVGCARVNPNWPKELIGCAVDSAPGAILDVSRVLLLDGNGTELSPDGRAEMTQLAARWGGKTVACAADTLIRELKSVDPSPASEDAISRCRDFLNGIGVKGGSDAVRQQGDEGHEGRQGDEGRNRRERHEGRQGDEGRQKVALI